MLKPELYFKARRTAVGWLLLLAVVFPVFSPVHAQEPGQMFSVGDGGQLIQVNEPGQIFKADQPVYGTVISSGVTGQGSETQNLEPVNGLDACLDCYGERECDQRLQKWFDTHFENNWLYRHTIAVKGWVEQGVTFNLDFPRNNSNTPVGFNDRANEYLMDQVYLSFSREAEVDPYDHGLGLGVDLFWGSDARFTKAPGLDSGWLNSHGIYQVSMPQMFLEFYLPYEGGIDLKVGRFYSILGYESVTAPDNFFYSHSYTFLYGEPFTHTGALADWQIDDRFSASLGIHNGWNDFEDTDAHPFGLLGGVSYRDDLDRFTFAYAFSWSEEANEIYADYTSGRRVPVINEGDRFVQSMVASVRISDRLRYVVQSDYGIQSNGAVKLDPVTRRVSQLQNAEWYGLNQYLIYKVNDRLTAGVRYEWFHDDDGTRVPNGQEQQLSTVGAMTVGAIQGVDGFGSIINRGDYHSLTFGLNWKFRECVVVRPELRIDISDVMRTVPARIDGVFDDLSDDNQVTLGTDVIIRF